MPRCWLRLRSLGLAILTACGGGEDPPLPDPPGPDAPLTNIRDVEIVPPSVWATPGAAFVLRVRIHREPDGYVVLPPSGTDPTWTGSPTASVVVEGLTGGAASGPAVLVRVPVGASDPGNVVVTLDGHTATAPIHVVEGSGTPTGDIVVDDRPASMLGIPPVALAEGAPKGEACPSYRTRAYGGAGAIGGKVLVENMEAGCDGEASLYAQAQGSEHAARVWQDVAGEEVHVPAGSAMTPPQPSPVGEIQVVVRVAVTPDEGFAAVEPAVRSALTHAAAVFDTNRVGLAFVLAEDKVDDIRGTKGADWKPTLPKIADAYQCPDLVAEGLAHPDSLVVFVVADLTLGTASGYKGFTCTQSTTQGQVVFVAFPHVAHTLAHELGHTTIGPGHPKMEDGFPSHNLLVISSASGSAAPPAHISLGQAFRAIRGSHSWWNARVARPGERDCTAACPPPFVDPTP